MRGIITEIQRFSIHDGPGIRTTVFLKGCNMKCAWCHNPETLSSRPQLQLFLEKCIGCGECLRVCPKGAHQIVDGQRTFKRELCQGCGLCAAGCYAEALVLIGKEMSPQEVVKEVSQDKPFYENSGGGVTLSGGEPLCQKEFTYEVLKQSKEQGIHTAIESNMSLPWEQAAFILPVTDLIMMDIKTMDDSLHKHWTGISNERVLSNVRMLAENSKPLIIRTPVIPGINDKKEDIQAVARFIAAFPNLLYYELLPYHPLGTGKYERLGMPYRLSEVKRPDSEKMKSLAAAARDCGIQVKTSDEDER